MIVDDRELVRTGFRLFLETQYDLEVVGEAGDGSEAIERARKLRPDVVLMVIRMLRMDGVEGTAWLTPRGSTRHRVCSVLTTFDLEAYAARGRRRIPAQGRAARAPDRGDPRRPRRRGAALALDYAPLIEHFAARTDPLQPPALLEHLTPREHEVLLLVARGLSNTEIAERLVVTEATVKSHVRSVLLELGLRDTLQAVVLAYEHGIVVAGDPGETGSQQPRCRHSERLHPTAETAAWDGGCRTNFAHSRNLQCGAVLPCGRRTTLRQDSGENFTRTAGS